MKLSHLNALRALEAVLRTGGFRTAAEELGVTTAAIGQQIRGLEAFVGRNLFIRSPGGVHPTDQALRLRNRLTYGFWMVHEVLEELRDVHSSNRIGITLPESFAENWFTKRISEFYRLNSEVDLRLNASNRRVDLVAEGFDFAIRYSPPPEDEFACVDLFGDHVLPLCTPGLAEKYGLSESNSTLDGVPLVHLDNRTPDPQWPDWQSWRLAFGVDPGDISSGVRYSRISSGLQAAVSGQGLVLCGITEAYDSVVSGQLIMPFGPDKRMTTEYRYRLLWLKDRNLGALQRSFRDWITGLAHSFNDCVTELLRG
ncbi:LysR family transcriptional regulator [Hoeflea sp. WL0058]|uniref:LysR family transcriptional regulator n=1 Tax=Flavimaribacter sediminis TaxID=2865987 RepID=A0AAE2ZUK0_9HYPH|nr:LysR substrate-binding domain-containing protein [Flavimaribacter sediminis]MBW8640663.1 LysR family transcriptional regulator [Flavimaribacter sediminis]